MSPDVIYAGLDPGFNAIKIARVQNGEICSYILPASVGEPSRGKKDGLTLAGVVRPQRATRRPFRVVFDQTEYLVGPNISDFAEPVDRLDFDRFTDSPELRATFYAAVHQITAGGGPRRMALAIALPVEVVQDKIEALRIERAMRGWLVNTFTALSQAEIPLTEFSLEQPSLDDVFLALTDQPMMDDTTNQKEILNDYNTYR